jgi:methylated-DNA-[protein]-cysteine S-methyltransferase
MNGLVVSSYETSYGIGSLIWRGDLLVSHELPRESGAGSLIKPLVKISTATALQMELVDSLQSYFSCETGSGFDLDRLPLDLSGLSAFEHGVAVALSATSFGELISYADLALAAGYPGAARAVGNFMAKNPWPVIIPCHRVIRSDGRIGGFSYGEDWKRRLIALEGINLDAVDVAKMVAS